MNELSLWLIILILFIGIPVFFISKTRMKKGSPKKKLIKAAAYGILSVFLFPFFILILLLSIIMKDQYFPPKEIFDRVKWSDTLSDERYKLSRDIIDSELLKNKTDNEVIELLGEQFIIKRDSSLIIYFTGYQPSFMTHIPRTLEVLLKNGKVYQTTMNKTDQDEIHNHLLNH